MEEIHAGLSSDTQHEQLLIEAFKLDGFYEIAIHTEAVTFKSVLIRMG